MTLTKTKYNKKKSQVKRRVFDNKKNREFGTYGNYDGKDVSHKGKKIVLERSTASLEAPSSPLITSKRVFFI